jgi:hypothetical protein
MGELPVDDESMNGIGEALYKEGRSDNPAGALGEFRIAKYYQ